MIRLAAALLLLACDAAADAQAVEMRMIPAPDRDGRRAAPPPPDLATIPETEFRILLSERRLHGPLRSEAIAAFRHRFTSEAARAFALNAEAQTRLDARDPEGALALYTQVRTEFGESRDPAVEAEVAEAMQGQVQALGAAEARADAGPLEPLTPESIDLDSRSNRLRQEIVTRFAGRAEPAIRTVVAQERFNLIELETIRSVRFTDPPRLTALIAEFEDSEEPRIRRLIADILMRLARFEPDDRAAIAYLDDFLRRFGHSTERELRSLVFDAYDNKRYLLEQLGEDARAALVQAEQSAWFGRAYPQDE